VTRRDLWDVIHCSLWMFAAMMIIAYAAVGK